MRRRLAAPVAAGPRLALALPLAVALAACGPVEVDVPELTGADRTACAALADDLPDRLADQERVEIEPANAPAAAYGDPPIVVRCGVGEPAGFGPGAQCELVNDVPFYIPLEQYDDQELDLTITSAWHAPRLEVRMPADYRGRGAEAGVMATLSGLVAEHLRPTGRCDL